MLRKLAPLALFVCLSAGTSCSRPDQPVVVATVGGEPILAEDLKRALNEHTGSYGPDVLADPEGAFVVKKTLVNELVQEKVLLQAAREKSVSLSPEEEKSVEEQIREGYRKGEFEKVLREKKISPEQWTAKQKNKRVIEKLIDAEVYASLRPTDKEIEAYYKKYRALFRLPDRIRCRHIVTDKKDKAERIRSLLEKGENFASVAQKYSESPDRENGGDLGYVARGEYPEIFERVCFTLATGQTSDVVPSEYGFHIFRVTDKQPSRQQPLKEVSEDIARRLKEEKAEPALRAWIETLYSNKKITIDEKALRDISVTATPEDS